jgi:GPH family glycoside/pentoside/hexuronide:cation symporter
MVFIGMIAVILMIPGIKDDKYMVERYLEKCDQEVERESFIKIFKTAIKSKNYMIIVIGYFLMQTTTACLLSSIYYLTNFILMEPDADTLVMIPFLLGALIASPTWTYLANRIDDNRKAMLISSSIEILFLIPLLIAQNMVLAMIGSGLFGFAFGGHAVIYRGILFPDAIDETVVIMGKRREGTFIGVRDFFGRLSFLAQAGIFAFIHIITGFDPTTTNQTDLAKLGISIHLALVPIICTAIVTLLIWKVYDITPEKSKEIRAKIIELKL